MYMISQTVMFSATFGQFIGLIHLTWNQTVACPIPAGHSTSLQDPTSLQGISDQCSHVSFTFYKEGYSNLY